MTKIAYIGRSNSFRCLRCLIIAALATVSGAHNVAALDFANGELAFTPRLTVGAVSWDELRSKGGHKSIVGIGAAADYRVAQTGVNFDVWKWWVSEGLDSNKGIIPKDGHRIKLEARRIYSASETIEWYPYAGIAYEAWNRHSLPEKWSSLDAFSGLLGLGIEQSVGYAKAGINFPFAASTDNQGDPTPRIGFDTEAGLRFSAFSVGLFWRGSAFQEPDAKLIQAGAFCGYTF